MSTTVIGKELFRLEIHSVQRVEALLGALKVVSAQDFDEQTASLERDLDHLDGETAAERALPELEAIFERIAAENGCFFGEKPGDPGAIGFWPLPRGDVSGKGEAASLVEAVFVVPRQSGDETTVAIVEARVGVSLRGARAFRDALRRALTAWARETDAGRSAWEASAHDFNVGDLRCECSLEDIGSLADYLRREGIEGLRVVCHATEDPSGGWDFDDRLIDADGLESAQ